MPVVRSRVLLQVPRADLFAYYARPANVLRLAPPDLGVRLIRGPEVLAPNAEVVFSIRPRVVPFDVPWTFRIQEFVQDRSFREVLTEGPFQSWEHRHEFEDAPEGGSVVLDTIEFDRPKAFLALVASPSWIAQKLEEVFRWRERMLRQELESAPKAPAP